MKNKCILKCVLFALVAFNSLAIMAQTTQQAAKAEKKFLQPERVRYDGSCMTIEGKDIFIYSAAFHYFRCPEDYGETVSVKSRKPDSIRWRHTCLGTGMRESCRPA